MDERLICAIEEAADAASVVCGGWFSAVLSIGEVALMPVVVAGTAIAAWRVQLDILARRAAWDYITDRELEAAWLELSGKAIRLLAAKPRRSDWEEFAARWSQSNLSKEEEAETNPIFQWLNRREFVAISLLDGTMHLRTYAEWWGVEFIHEWRRAEGFVEALRATERGDADVYSKFGKVAKWEELVGEKECLARQAGES